MLFSVRRAGRTALFVPGRNRGLPNWGSPEDLWAESRAGPVGKGRPADPERPEPDRVGGDAGVADPVDVALDGERPLTLDVQVPVDAGGDTRPLATVDAGAGTAVLVEWRVVPEDVE